MREDRGDRERESAQGERGAPGDSGTLRSKASRGECSRGSRPGARGRGEHVGVRVAGSATAGQAPLTLVTNTVSTAEMPP